MATGAAVTTTTIMAIMAAPVMVMVDPMVADLGAVDLGAAVPVMVTADPGVAVPVMATADLGVVVPVMAMADPGVVGRMAPVIEGMHPHLVGTLPLHAITMNLPLGISTTAFPPKV